LSKSKSFRDIKIAKVNLSEKKLKNKKKIKKQKDEMIAETIKI